MAIIRYYVTSEMFGDKERVFDDKAELNTWLHAKTTRMVPGFRKKYPELTDKQIYRKIKKNINVEGVNELNIGSGQPYPAGALSNFAPHPFTIDGVDCASMEGFLQALKVKDVNMQRHVCTLVGREAKAAGAGRNWKQKQQLYWNGDVYKRYSQEYTDLIERAYREMFKNTGFRKALAASGKATLAHSMGGRKKSDTVLTRREFTGMLTKLRSEL